MAKVNDFLSIITYAACKKYVDSQNTKLEMIVAWNGQSTPDVTKIPQGVSVTYNGTTYTGTLAASASTAGKIYFVYDNTGTAPNVYKEYVTIGSGTYSWECLGTTQIDLTDYEKKLTIKTALDSPLVEHCLYNLGNKSELSFTLPATASSVDEIIIVAFTATAAFTPTVSGTTAGNALPATVSGKSYQVLYSWTGSAWLCQYLCF